MIFKIRDTIDNVFNRNGDLLIEFLVDCNFCMINGREGKQDFTNFSTKGKSVVDCVSTPHDQIIIGFNANCVRYCKSPWFSRV